MAPLTPQSLSQRGRPKTDKSGKIQSLNSSGSQSLSEHLDPNLSGRSKKSRELDLSNNLSETSPANSGSSHSRILRCTNNQLGDVTALHQFPELEELNSEGNPFSTVSDNLKVSFLSPKLRKVNGKDTASTCSQVENLDRESMDRVTAHWQKFIATVSPEEETDKVRADFMRSAVRDVCYGPESLIEFTQWRVRMIAEESVASGGAQVQDAKVPVEHPQAAGASKFRAREVASKRPGKDPVTLPPSKRVRALPPAQAEGSPMGADGGQAALHSEPSHFSQCHSRNNSPKDSETQSWACAFEPAREEGHSRATSQTVATCGGEAVCVIDCQTGLVLHKYKVPGEEFFSVAWTALTVVTQAGHKKRWNMLAAAGLRGMVRSSHVRAGFCCSVIRAHKKAIATLCFSPSHETHLFTASYDKRIILWDIGVPNQDYKFQASQLLTLNCGSVPLRLCPVATCPDDFSSAGCEGGCYCWDVRLDQPQKQRVCEVNFIFSEDSKVSGQRVDGSAFVNEDVVASKGSGQGTIYSWSWSQTWAGRGRQSVLPVVISVRSQWSPTNSAYFSLSTCPGKNLVSCGDEEGSVWIYDVEHLSKEPPQATTSQPPTQISKWPQPTALGQPVTKTMINTVVANAAFTYLTASTDSNIVSIWRRC